MSKTMSDLIIDVLPRLINAPKGIGIYQAANSVLSLVYKKLLDWGSDLLASGQLQLVIPPFGNSAPLPADFISPAGKMESEDFFSDWMAGTVTSYDSGTGALVVNATNAGGSDTFNVWYIAVAALPGSPSTIIAQSSTSLVVGTGSKSLTINTGATLPAGTYIFILPGAIVGTADTEGASIDGGTPGGSPPPAWLVDGGGVSGFPSMGRKKHLQPSYLTDDDEYDDNWWTSYSAVTPYRGYEYSHLRPHRYRVIGRTLYIRPKVVMAVAITGRYFQKPLDFSLPTDTIPWDLFYEVFREGVVRVIMKSISIPDADPDFMLFIKREVDIVMSARGRQLPSNRSSRRDFT